jgi:hypothetical protein
MQAYLGPAADGRNKRWSVGSGVWSPEALRMSPVQSRARTPSVSERVGLAGQDEEEYFGLQIPKVVGQGGEVLAVKGSGNGKEIRRKSLGAEVKETKRDRSKNSSGESISSMGSKTAVRRVPH